MPGPEIVKLVEETDLRKVAGRRRLPRPLSKLALLRWPYAEYSSPGFASVIKSALGRDPKLGELIPFATTGVDIVSGDLLVYSSQDQENEDMPVSEAVQIATAVPLMYAPYQPAGQIVVDGAFASASPVWLVPGQADDHPIIVLRIGEETTLDRPRNFAEFLGIVVQSGVHSRDRIAIDQMPRVRCAEVKCGGVKFDDFGLSRERREYLVRAGRKAIAELLERYGHDLMDTVIRAPPPEPRAEKPDRDQIARQRGYELMTAYNRTLSTLVRNKVFISYSHKDDVWLEQVVKQLKPLLRNSEINVWSDRNITPGLDWKRAIDDAIAAAKVAILLVSGDFLASDFIVEHELPSLLEAAESERLTLVCVPVTPSNWEATALAQRQWAHDPKMPLTSLDEYQRDAALVSVSKKVKEAMLRD
jgi:predicted acylesterase/phospholipase RssA